MLRRRLNNISRSQSVGFLLASAAVPRSFQQSLMPRSNVDQGIITGVVTTLVYLLGVIVEDGKNYAVDKVVSNPDNTTNQDKFTNNLLVSGAVIAIGHFLTQRYNYQKNERLSRSGIRTSSDWLMKAGIAGAVVSSIELINNSLSKNDKVAEERDLLPYFIGAGLIISSLGEYARIRKEDGVNIRSLLMRSELPQTVGVGAAVAAALTALAYTERYLAKQVDAVIGNRSKQLKDSWLPAGHLFAIGGMFYGLTKVLRSVYSKIEQAADEYETSFTNSPNDNYVSGSKNSLIKWNSMTVQGRRHIYRRLSAAKISKVMNEPAVEPIRVFVGLESAPTEEERVELALRELVRIGAYDRKTLVVISPTGTGYVNYVLSEALEFHSRGNVASITLQYSNRPSPMSLDRVDEGHIQYRMLLNGIYSTIKTLPARKRPRIVLFGESLGAWTSQDAFMHSGTDGFKALGIERALWIGTPKGSKWKDQIQSDKWLNSEPGLIGVFDNYQEFIQLDRSQRAKLRYFMVTHLNDPIAQFSADILIKEPEWAHNNDARPKGLRRSVGYRTPTLFVQMLVDMKNALKPKPGDFVANGHDYRADLAAFTAAAYNYKLSPEQLQAVELALRKNEIELSRLIAKGKKPANIQTNK